MIMIKLIRSEFIKNRVWVCSTLAILIPIITGVFIKTQIINRTVDYIDIPVDTYAFSIFCNSYLFFIMPIFVLLISIFFAQNESKANGWILVLSTVKSADKVMMAKCFVNILILFVSYISFTCVNCYLLQEWGMGVLFTAVILPMLYSFFCFVPIAIIAQILSIVLPYVIETVFLGMFLVLLNVFVTQTKYNKYFIPSFYITIAQDLSHAEIKVMISILVAVGIICLGAKLTKKYIQLFFV